MARFIKQDGYPKVLAIGSSHVTHWKRYRWSIKLPEDDLAILQNFHFMGVGGAKLIDLLDLLEAKDLPPNKQELQDQWKKLKEKTSKPIM